MKLTVNQKRFLIIWIIFHSFALFVNLANIEGFYSKYVNPKNDPYKGYTSVYLLTHKTDINKDKFWPFTSFRTGEPWIDSVFSYQHLEKYGLVKSLNYTEMHNNHYFNGIFNSYDLSEYIFYMMLGLGFIFIPKLWRDTNVQKQNR